MTEPEPPAGRPAVYARLAEDAEVRAGGHMPRASARWFGWALCVALIAGVVVAAIRVDSW